MKVLLAALMFALALTGCGDGLVEIEQTTCGTVTNQVTGQNQYDRPIYHLHADNGVGTKKVTVDTYLRNPIGSTVCFTDTVRVEPTPEGVPPTGSRFTGPEDQ